MSWAVKKGAVLLPALRSGLECVHQSVCVHPRESDSSHVPCAKAPRLRYLTLSAESLPPQKKGRTWLIGFSALEALDQVRSLRVSLHNDVLGRSAGIHTGILAGFAGT